MSAPREGDQKFDLFVFPAGGPDALAPGLKAKALWYREGYASPDAALRAAAQLQRRFIGAHMVVSPLTWRPPFWIADTEHEFAIFWCALCGKRLDWADDMWICGGPLGCGDEWADETIRPAAGT